MLIAWRDTRGLVPWLVVLMGCINSATPMFHGPADHLSVALVTWGGQHARFSAILYQGPKEAKLVARLAFSTPPIFAPNGSALASVIGHPPLVIRASDTTSMALVSDAPVGLMRRTAISTRQVLHHFQVDVANTPTDYARDWLAGSKWKAVFFLDPASSLWHHFACYVMETRPLGHLDVLSDPSACSASMEASAARWATSAYDYSMPRDFSVGDGSTRAHQRRYGALLLGNMIITEPVLSETQKMAMGECLGNDDTGCVRGANNDPAYAVILDLESQRNYMPAELYYMTPAPVRLVLQVVDDDNNNMDGTLLIIDWPRVHTEFTPNPDSQEIVIGLSFARSNYTAITFDARSMRVGVQFLAPGPSDGLRIIVIILICIQQAIVVRWIDSRNFASMRIVREALERTPLQRQKPHGGADLTLPFERRQVFWEVLALALSVATFGLVVAYVNRDYVPVLVVASVQLGLHVALSMVLLALTHQETRSALLDTPQLLVAEGADDPERASVSMQPYRHVLARNALHIFVLCNGILVGLLLATDSIIVLVAAIAVALFLLYHLAYYLATMAVCSIVLRTPEAPAPAPSMFLPRQRAPDSSGASTALWAAYVVLEVATYASVLYATHQFLIGTVLTMLNGVYSPMIISIVTSALEMAVTISAAHAVFSEATGTS